MTKATKMAKVSVKGGFNLLWGLVASTVISSLGTIFTANLLGDTNYGFYVIALAAPNLISTLRDWGMPSAIVKYTAQYNAEDKATNVRSIFASGILFETVLGLILAAVAFLLSGLLANLYSLPNITGLIQISSFTVLTGALFGTAQAAFTGMERMGLNSVAMIVQAIVKTTVVPVLVIFGLGALGAVIGFLLASLVGGLIALLLMWSLHRRLPRPTNNGTKIKATVRIMFNYGFPLSIATIFATFQTQFYWFILPIFVTPDMIGNYGVASSFVVLITFFATPVSTMLFPAFSKLDPQKDRDALKNVFQYSIKYASLLVVPVAAIVMALAKPGVSILFPTYPVAQLFLALLAIGYLFVALGNLSVSNLLNGQGQTMFSMKLSIITFSIGVPLSIVLISRVGVLGLIVTMLTAHIPSLMIALRWLKKRYGVTVAWTSSAKILLSGGTASAITYVLAAQLALNNVVTLVIGSLVFFSIFLLTIAFTGAITQSDIANMREIMTALGPLARLADSVLNTVERLMTLFRSQRS